MEDKTLKTALLEKQTSTKVQAPVREEKPKMGENLKVNLTKIKEQSANDRKSKIEEKQSKKVVNKNQINFFGGEYDLEAVKDQVQEVVEKDNSSVIETPNYDFIEPLSEEAQEKIFVVEKSKETKKKASPLLRKIKLFTLVLLIGVFGSWTIYNAVELSNIVTEYNLKLDQYLLKLGTLDSASSMNDLFPTYPEGENQASTIEAKTNWFDRFCNFIAGIFGG